MKLAEAFLGNAFAGAERGSEAAWSIIHHSRGGFHLSRSLLTEGQRTSHVWTFPNLYELLLFAQQEGFAEIDPEAEDWQPVFKSP
jgi:ABC-type Zn uptake system ZnuABC Zn-binding protein ZnuA